MLHADAFRAMDTDVDIEIEAPMRPHGAFVSMRLLFEEQEQRFSRFRPGSLLSRLNRGETIDDGTFTVACSMAIEAHAFTSGLFNPMVLSALNDAGYDRTFRDVRGGAPTGQVVPDPRNCLRIEGGAVSLRNGQLDLGGVIKGWTADLAAEALAAEYVGALVNAGGDVRTIGNAREGEGWQLAIERRGGGTALWQGQVSGGCATSTTLRRRWTTASGAAHHLIDPRTGLPSSSPFVQVTAWAPSAWRAEVWAKAVLIGGEIVAEDALRVPGVTVLTVDANGQDRIWR